MMKGRAPWWLFFGLPFVLVLLGCVGDGSRAFSVEQRTTVQVPTLGGVMVSVGDIERGTRADEVRVFTNEEVLAFRDTVKVGERVRFAFEEQSYEIRVEGFSDHPFYSPQPDEVHLLIYEK